MSHAPDIVADRPGILQETRHHPPHVLDRGAGTRRGDAGLGRVPHRLLGALGGVRDLAHGVIAVSYNFV